MLTSVTFNLLPDINGYQVIFLGTGNDPALQLNAQIVMRYLNPDGSEFLPAQQQLGQVTLDDTTMRSYPNFQDLRNWLRTTIITKAQAANIIPTS